MLASSLDWLSAASPTKKEKANDELSSRWVLSTVVMWLFIMAVAPLQKFTSCDESLVKISASSIFHTRPFLLLLVQC